MQRNKVIASAVLQIILMLSCAIHAEQKIINPITTEKKIIKSSWEYRSIAESAVALTSEASQTQNDNRKILTNKSAEQINYLISSMTSEGTWWNPSRGTTGDPNVNRFVLAPLLDAIEIADRTNDYPKEISKWKTQVLIAAEFQYKAYHNQISWDLGAQSFKKYPNQDVYYLLICALAHKIGGEDKFQHDEQEALEGLEDQLMPNGGWHYISEETESPIYHYITEIILARYHEITKSARALTILKSSTRYWDKILSTTGQPSYTADPWWKQFWQPIPRSAIQLAWHINNSDKLYKILELNQENFSKELGTSKTYIKEWNRSDTKLKPPFNPTHGFNFDIDAKRYFSEKNNLYVELVEGRGLRNTFAGIRYCSEKSNKSCSTIRAITPKINVSAGSLSTLFLSEPEDDGRYVEGIDGVAYAINYKIHPALINSTPKPKPIESPFSSQQIWYAKNDGITGVISIQANKPINTENSLISIAVGPEFITHTPGSDTYKSGNLIVKIFKSFGKSTIVPEKIIKPAIWPIWKNIQIGFDEPKLWDAGDEHHLILWIGHDEAYAPMSITYDSKNTTLKAQYQESSTEIIHKKNTGSIKIVEKISID